MSGTLACGFDADFTICAIKSAICSTMLLFFLAMPLRDVMSAHDSTHLHVQSRKITPSERTSLSGLSLHVSPLELAALLTA